MSGLRDVHAQFTDQDAQVLGVSMGNLETQTKFAESHNLPFPLLADPEGVAAKAYGVANVEKGFQNNDGLVKECAKVDKPIAGLLTDLARRGLLDDTLVVWGAEFGRTPTVENTDGRNHHPAAFSIWMAGGGVRGGLTYGSTDDFGFHPVDNPVHMHDLHATLLYALGLDHKRLTYRYAGRDFRLTDVYGTVQHALFS